MSEFCKKCGEYIFADRKCQCKGFLITDDQCGDKPFSFYCNAHSDESAAERYAERNFVTHDYRLEWELKVNGIKMFVEVRSEPAFYATKERENPND